MIMYDQKKIYIGAIKTEIQAARYYDIVSFLIQGLSAKTNFSYTKGQLKAILEEFNCIIETKQEIL